MVGLKKIGVWRFGKRSNACIRNHVNVQSRQIHSSSYQDVSVADLHAYRVGDP